MAIVQNPITGRTKNKFASAVFSKQFGKNTMRSKPIEVKNPRTQDQVSQRKKFSLIVALARLILSMIHIAFQNMAIGMSAFNAFVSANIKTAITGTPGNWSIDYALLTISKGPLFKTTTVDGAPELNGSIKRTWDPPIDPLDPSNLDLIYVASYNKIKNQWLFGKTAVARSVGEASQTVPAAWVGDTVHVYSFFINPDGNQCSDSNYSGTVVII